jgi:hypothetical protein
MFSYKAALKWNQTRQGMRDGPLAEEIHINVNEVNFVLGWASRGPKMEIFF